MNINNHKMYIQLGKTTQLYLTLNHGLTVNLLLHGAEVLPRVWDSFSSAEIFTRDFHIMG